MGDGRQKGRRKYTPLLPVLLRPALAVTATTSGILTVKSLDLSVPYLVLPPTLAGTLRPSANDVACAPVIVLANTTLILYQLNLHLLLELFLLL